MPKSNSPIRRMPEREPARIQQRQKAEHSRVQKGRAHHRANLRVRFSIAALHCPDPADDLRADTRFFPHAVESRPGHAGQRCGNHRSRGARARSALSGYLFNRGGTGMTMCFYALDDLPSSEYLSRHERSVPFPPRISCGVCVGHLRLSKITRRRQPQRPARSMAGRLQ